MKRALALTIGLLLLASLACKSEWDYDWDNPYDTHQNADYGTLGQEEREALATLLQDPELEQMWNSFDEDSRRIYAVVAIYFRDQNNSNYDEQGRARPLNITDANKPGIYVPGIEEGTDWTASKNYRRDWYPANPYFVFCDMESLGYDQLNREVYIGEDDNRWHQQTAAFHRGEVKVVTFDVYVDADEKILYGTGGWNLNPNEWFVQPGQTFNIHIVSNGQLSGSPSGNYTIALNYAPVWLGISMNNTADPYFDGTAPATGTWPETNEFELVAADANNTVDSMTFYNCKFIVDDAAPGPGGSVRIRRQYTIFEHSNWTNSMAGGQAIIGEVWDSYTNWRNFATFLVVNGSGTYTVAWDWPLIIETDLGSMPYSNPPLTDVMGENAYDLVYDANWGRPGMATNHYSFWALNNSDYRLTRTNWTWPSGTDNAFIAVDVEATRSNSLTLPGWEMLPAYMVDSEGDGDPYFSGGWHQGQGIVVLDPTNIGSITDVVLKLKLHGTITTLDDDLVVLGMMETQYYDWQNLAADRYVTADDMGWRSMLSNSIIARVASGTSLTNGSYDFAANVAASPNLAYLRDWIWGVSTDPYYLVFLFWNDVMWSVDLPAYRHGDNYVHNLLLGPGDVQVIPIE